MHGADGHVHEAKTHLSRLFEAVGRGEDVVIARAGRPVARLVPVTVAAQPRVPGAWRGTGSRRGRLRRDAGERAGRLPRRLGLVTLLLKVSVPEGLAEEIGPQG